MCVLPKINYVALAKECKLTQWADTRNPRCILREDTQWASIPVGWINVTSLGTHFEESQLPCVEDSQQSCGKRVPCGEELKTPAKNQRMNLRGSRSASSSQGFNLTATSWDSEQEPPARPLPDFWPPQNCKTMNPCFKSLSFG